MDKETLKRTNKSFEAIGEQYAYVDGGFCDFPLSGKVLEQLEKLSGMTTEEKVDLFNNSAAQVRDLAGHIRDEAGGTKIDVPGLGSYNFEFNGRRKAGKDAQDEEVSLRITRHFDPPENLRSPRTFAILKRISDREAPLIKTPGNRLNLRKRQRLPQVGTFAVLFDALETVGIMHKALGLGKQKQSAKTKKIKSKV